MLVAYSQLSNQTVSVFLILWFKYHYSCNPKPQGSIYDKGKAKADGLDLGSRDICELLCATRVVVLVAARAAVGEHSRRRTTTVTASTRVPFAYTLTQCSDLSGQCICDMAVRAPALTRIYECTSDRVQCCRVAVGSTGCSQAVATRRAEGTTRLTRGRDS